MLVSPVRENHGSTPYPSQGKYVLLVCHTVNPLLLTHKINTFVERLDLLPSANEVAER